MIHKNEVLQTQLNQVRKKFETVESLDQVIDFKEKKDEQISNKSLLERRMFVYADLNPKVKSFSIEPFSIRYIKPTDNKIHRYYIDVFLEFVNGSKFFVEIKPYSETIYPKKPKLITEGYKKKVVTYIVNQAKWNAAKKIAKEKGCEFIIMTENELR